MSTLCSFAIRLTSGEDRVRRASSGVERGASAVAGGAGDSVVGTQGTPVEVLGRLIHHVFFPELWRVRNELTALSQEQQKA